jgi:hypothetical protein
MHPAGVFHQLFSPAAASKFFYNFNNAIDLIDTNDAETLHVVLFNNENSLQIDPESTIAY